VLSTSLIAGLLALPLLLLAPNPLPAYAGECIVGGEEGGGAESATLLIRFIEGGGNGPETNFRGFRVTITPNPVIFTHAGSLAAVDDGFGDDDDGTNIGEIVIDDACQTDHADFPGPYTLVADILPGSDAAGQGCRLGNNRLQGQTVAGDEGAVRVFTFAVFCTTSSPPPASMSPSGPGVAVPANEGEPPAEEATVEVVPEPVVPAGPITIEVNATGAEAVPSVASVARAFARFVFDESQRRLDYAVSVFGYSAGQVRGVQLQRAAAGENGPVVHVLRNTGFIQTAGLLLDLSDDDIAAIKAGEWYLNVLSADFPSGFARGQLILPSAPSAPPPPPPSSGSLPESAEEPDAPSGTPTGFVVPPNTGEAGLAAPPTRDLATDMAGLIALCALATLAVCASRRTA
jgi:hypothetical protein